MQIASGPMAEFECDSNAVACPRLYPGRARRIAPQDRVASGGRKYSNPSRAEIRIRIDVSSDTCLRIENRYARRKVRDSRGRGKNIQISLDVARAAFVVRHLNE